MPRKLNIFFFSNNYCGGIETFLNQIRTLSKNKFNIKFHFYKKDRFGTYHKDHIFLQQKLTSNHITTPNIILFFSNLWKSYHIIRRDSPHFIVSFPNYSFIVITLIKKITRLKFINIIIINNNIQAIIRGKNLARRIVLNSLMRFLLRSASILICTSKQMADDLCQQYHLPPEKIRVIPHSVTLCQNRYGHIPRPYPTDISIKSRRLFKIFSVGRLDAQKDLPTLLKAFSIVLNKKDCVELFIIGDGHDKNKLIQMAQDLGISSKTHFLGWKKNALAYLKYADLFIFSSQYEGFGMTIVEAMSTGVPVISSDCPYGPSEILAFGKYGILVSVGDYRGMASQIIRLISNTHLRNQYSKLSHIRAEAYSTKKMLQEYDTLFTHLAPNIRH